MRLRKAVVAAALIAALFACSKKQPTAPPPWKAKVEFYTKDKRGYADCESNYPSLFSLYLDRLGNKPVDSTQTEVYKAILKTDPLNPGTHFLAVKAKKGEEEKLFTWTTTIPPDSLVVTYSSAFTSDSIAVWGNTNNPSTATGEMFRNRKKVGGLQDKNPDEKGFRLVYYTEDRQGGVYSVNVSIKDIYNQKEEFTVSQHIPDTQPPEITLGTNVSQDGGRVYTKANEPLSRIEVNGNQAPLTGVYTWPGDPSNVYRFVVTATDTAGNQTTKQAETISLVLSQETNIENPELNDYGTGIKTQLDFSREVEKIFIKYVSPEKETHTAFLDQPTEKAIARLNYPDSSNWKLSATGISGTDTVTTESDWKTTDPFERRAFISIDGASPSWAKDDFDKLKYFLEKQGWDVTYLKGEGWDTPFGGYSYGPSLDQIKQGIHDMLQNSDSNTIPLFVLGAHGTHIGDWVIKNKCVWPEEIINEFKNGDFNMLMVIPSTSFSKIQIERLEGIEKPMVIMGSCTDTSIDVAFFYNTGSDTSGIIRIANKYPNISIVDLYTKFYDWLTGWTRHIPFLAAKISEEPPEKRRELAWEGDDLVIRVTEQNPPEIAWAALTDSLGGIHVYNPEIEKYLKRSMFPAPHATVKIE